MASLAERLGYDADARLLVLACNNLGVSHSANLGVYSALRIGLATTAGLMVPCPWAREAAGKYKNDDVGVQLTFNSEHTNYRWGPITQAPTLLDGNGGFPETVDDLWEHADVDEVRREGRAQLERAIHWGLDVTHLGSHLDALLLRPEFFDTYLELALETKLPIRLPVAESEDRAQFPMRALAAAEGVVVADHAINIPSVGTRDHLVTAIADLQPGVTEAAIHPAADTPELRAYADDWRARVDDHELVTGDAELERLLDGVTLIGYRDLRDLQRNG